MDPVAIGAAVMTGAKYTKEAIGYVSDLNNAIHSTLEHGINSLTEYAKQTLISSRVYIEDALASEPIITDLMKYLQKVYAGLILSSLQIGSIVEGGRTVRQLLSPVSTETFHSFVDLVNEQFGKENVSVEALGTPINARSQDGIIKDADLFSGCLMSVTLGKGENTATIYLIVQLNPYIIPGVVMEEFLRINTDVPDSIRKAQLKAGEIKFWKDYIFECDKVARRKKALKLDKDGILREMEDHRTGGIWESIKNWFKPSAVVKHNIANSIIIVSKQKLDKVCKDTGLSMKSFKDRQSVFGNTMSMIMIAYDPNYETVDVYMNGISNRGEYSAQMIKNASKKEKEEDLKQLVTLLAAGTAPRSF